MQVQQIRDEIEARGARLVAVGQGSGEEAAAFCGRWGVGLPCLGDPDRESYRRLGLPRSNWWALLGRHLLTDPLRSFREIRESELAGARLKASDALQLGGVAIVDGQGAMRFLHVSQAPTDVPSNAELLAALDALAA